MRRDHASEGSNLKRVGLICAAAAISCPPAIPVAVYGERITEKTVEVMKYYGITHCSVIKQI